MSQRYCPCSIAVSRGGIPITVNRERDRGIGLSGSRERGRGVVSDIVRFGAGVRIVTQSIYLEVRFTVDSDLPRYRRRLVTRYIFERDRVIMIAIA